MTDPLDLFHRLVTVARQAIAPAPQTSVPAATVEQLVAEIKAERAVPREHPRVIGEEALLLANALNLLLDAREGALFVRANCWASISREMLDLVMLIAQEAGAPHEPN